MFERKKKLQKHCEHTRRQGTARPGRQKEEKMNGSRRLETSISRRMGELLKSPLTWCSAPGTRSRWKKSMDQKTHLSWRFFSSFSIVLERVCTNAKTEREQNSPISPQTDKSATGKENREEHVLMSARPSLRASNRNQKRRRSRLPPRERSFETNTRASGQPTFPRRDRAQPPPFLFLIMGGPAK